MKAKNAGFTLLEIMMVIALVAVLVGIGAPGMGDFIRNSRMTGKANDLLGGLNLARTEAIKRHVPVTVCATSDASAATPTCNAAADFSQWIAFVDDDGNPTASSGAEGNGTYEPLKSEVLLSRSSGSITSITTTPGEDADGDPLDFDGYIQYGLDGFQRRANGSAPTDLSILMCDDRGNRAVSGADTSAARGVFVTRTGRAEVTRSVDRIEDAGGCP